MNLKLHIVILLLLQFAILSCKSEELTPTPSKTADAGPKDNPSDPQGYIDFVHRVKVEIKKIELKDIDHIENITKDGLLVKDIVKQDGVVEYSFIKWDNPSEKMKIENFEDLYPTSIKSRLVVNSQSLLNKWKILDRFQVPEWNLAKIEYWSAGVVKAVSTTDLIFRDFDQEKFEIVYADENNLIVRDEKLLGLFELNGSKIDFVSYSDTALFKNLIYKAQKEFMIKASDDVLKKIELSTAKITTTDLDFKNFNQLVASFTDKHNIFISAKEAIIGGLIDNFFVKVDWTDSGYTQNDFIETYGFRTSSDKFILIPLGKNSHYFEIKIGEMYKRDIKK